MTVKQARGFFLFCLLAFVIMLCVIGWNMAEAFNLSPFTHQLRERGVPANYAYISGDTLYMNNMAVALAAVLKAVAVQTDTVRGASSIVGIVDDTLIVDTDSTGSDVTIRFGRWGAGLRWHRATDALQFSNDFSTWTAIGSGSGSSTTNADSLGHKVARLRPTTDNYYLKYDSDGDSLYLAAGSGGGTDEDSTFNAMRSQRWLPHPSLSGQYIGASTDSGFAEHVDSTSGNSYTRYWTPIWYWEVVPDSALPTWGRVEAAIAANGGGDITGVLANDWLTGSASSGDVSLGIDPALMAAIYLTSDTTVIEGTAVKIRNNDGVTQIKLDNDTVLVQNLNSGSLIFNVFGTPSDNNELVIKENQVIIGSGTTLSGYTETGDISSVVAGGGLTGGATSGAATVDAVGGWSLRVFPDSIAVRQISGDSITAGTVADARIATTLCRDTEASGLAHDTLWANTPGFATKANVHDSLFANTPGFLLKSLFKDSVVATGAKIPKAALADSAVKYDTATSLQWAEGRTIAHDTLWGNSPLFFRTAGNGLTSSSATVNIVGSDEITVAADSIYVPDSKIKSVHLEDGTVALADHAANSVDSTKIVDASIGSGDIGTGRITTTHVLDASLVGGDMATGTIDSIRLGTACVKAAELDTTVTYVIGNLRTRAANQGLIQSNNFKATDPDSTLKLGGGGGLTIGSNLRYGTDITDDTIWVDYYPEPQSMTLGDRIMPTYKDSMKIYGDVDSCGNLGNVLVFSDSLLNSGNHRRSLHYTIVHPHNVDSLRYILVYGLVKDSSGTNEMYLRGALRTTPWTRSCADSLTAGNIKDYDSLGGDFGDNQVVRKFALTGGAVTAGGAWYLLVTGRHDAGTAFNWAEVGLIRCVYSKLGPD